MAKINIFAVPQNLVACQRSAPYYIEARQHGGLRAIDVYQSISTHPKYQKLSFEEIRAQDYKAGRFGRDFDSPVGYVTAILGPLAKSRSLVSKRVPIVKSQTYVYHELPRSTF